MKSEERRNQILGALLSAPKPILGSDFATQFGVSRQIIVQDISLLKAAGHDILSTHYGYFMQKESYFERVFKVCHDSAHTEDELLTIIEHGGTVVNVYVWHKVYGRMEAPLHIGNRLHVKRFMEDIRTGKSSELFHITGGYHYHTVRAKNEHALDTIATALQQKGYIAPEI